MRTLSILPAFVSSMVIAQAPPIQWQKALGGSATESAELVRMTPGGGWLMASNCQSTNGNVVGHHGLMDIWLAKLDASGALEWTLALGGSGEDHVFGLEIATDGGCVVVGMTDSNDGDVNGNHGNDDAWVVKVDAAGALEWQRTLGGTNADLALDVVISGTGYLVTGITTSNDGDMTGLHGDQDIWLAQLDANGATSWLHLYGGSAWEHPTSTTPTSDGGWVLGATSASSDGDVAGAHGSWDLWVVKLDAAGVIQWQQTYGGTSFDAITNVFQTSDGGYITSAVTMSNNGDVVGHHGMNDYWLVKLDATGAIQWQKTMGGSDTDNATELILASDGGYIINGYTVSDDGDVVGQHAGNSGIEDFWVVKVNAAGTLLWARALGGSQEDFPHNDAEVYDTPSTLLPTVDGGCVLAGVAVSTNGDVVGNHGLSDAWAVKLDAGGAIQWQRALGGSNNEHGHQIHHAADGGYLISGYASSTNGDVTGVHGGFDAWLVKLGSDGTGIEEATSGNMTVSPSPAVDQVRVLTDRDMNGARIELTDMQGRVVLSERMIGAVMTIDVSTLARGQYTVTLLAPQVTLTQRLTLER